MPVTNKQAFNVHTYVNRNINFITMFYVIAGMFVENMNSLAPSLMIINVKDYQTLVEVVSFYSNDKLYFIDKWDGV